jgi:Anti-sigma factor NepR
MEQLRSNGDATDHSLEVSSSQEENAIELDPRIQYALGRALKTYYTDLVTAPIPDRFLVLLAQLDAKEAEKNGVTSHSSSFEIQKDSFGLRPEITKKSSETVL